MFRNFFRYCQFIFIADDIKKDLTAFNSVTSLTTTQASNATNRAEMMHQFCAIVQIYTDAKQ